MVDLDAVETEEDSRELKEMIEKYVAYTHSKEAEAILDNFAQAKEKFIKVMPVDYKRVLEERLRIKDEQSVTA